MGQDIVFAVTVAVTVAAIVAAIGISLASIEWVIRRAYLRRRNRL